MALTSLPIDLSNRSGLEAFFQALDDPANRASLAGAQLPAGPRQLVDLLNDPVFTNQALPLARRILEHRRAVATGTASSDPQILAQVKQEGATIKQHIETTYPDAARMLSDYADMYQPTLLAKGAGTLAANTDVVVNAAVWANAAAVTNVLVAAEAVVFAAVFVGGA